MICVPKGWGESFGIQIWVGVRGLCPEKGVRNMNQLVWLAIGINACMLASWSQHMDSETQTVGALMIRWKSMGALSKLRQLLGCIHQSRWSQGLKGIKGLFRFWVILLYNFSVIPQLCLVVCWLPVNSVFFSLSFWSMFGIWLSRVSAPT